MLNWIISNKEWLFSGIGVAAISVVLWLLRYGHHRWTEGRTAILNTSPNPAIQRPSYQQVRPKSITTNLPTFLLRTILKPETIASQIHIALRGENPISLNLSAEVPRVDLYFEITNLSILDLVLDRMLIDMWFGQPTFDHAILRRQLLPAGKITKGVYLRHELTTAQKKQIEAFIENPQQHGSIYLYLTAYFESKVGRLEVEQTIERRGLS